MNRLGEPGTEHAEKRPESEGSQAGEYLGAVMTELFVPLAFQTDQCAQRSTHQKALEEMIRIGGKHRSKG